MEIYDRGLRLKQLRKKRGLTQKEVADRLKICTGTVSAYERNIKTPSLEILEQLAILYNTSPNYILGFDKKTSLFIDDLTEKQQQLVLSILDILKNGIQSNADKFEQLSPVQIAAVKDFLTQFFVLFTKIN